MIPSRHYIPNISRKYGSLVVKNPGKSVIEMSEECRKRPLSKNEGTKPVRHFQENNYQEDDLHVQIWIYENLF